MIMQLLLQHPDIEWADDELVVHEALRAALRNSRFNVLDFIYETSPFLKEATSSQAR